MVPGAGFISRQDGEVDEPAPPSRHAVRQDSSPNQLPVGGVRSAASNRSTSGEHRATDPHAGRPQQCPGWVQGSGGPGIRGSLPCRGGGTVKATLRADRCWKALRSCTGQSLLGLAGKTL